MRKAVCLAVAVSFGLPICAPGGERKGSETLVASVTKPTVPQLIEQLGDRRYRVRERAQQLLAAVDDKVALPLLVKARAGAKDSEVVRRLDAVIPFMERNALLRGRRVTLHVDKLTLRDIAAELTRQTGYAIDVDNITPQTYTFNFDDVPFWVALDRVCAAAHVTIYPYYYGSSNDRIRLYSYGGASSTFVGYSEAFRLVATGFNYRRDITFTGPNASQPAAHSRVETLTLNFTIHSEPKLPILQVFPPEIAEAYDENRKQMAIKAVPTTSNYYDRSRFSKYGSGNRYFSYSTSVNLLRPTRDSKMAKLVKGEIPVLLSQEKPEIVMDQIVSIKKKKFTRSATEIEIEDVSENNNWGNGKAFAIKMSVKEDTDMKYNDYNWANTLQYRLDLFDAKGNKYVVWNNMLYSQGPRLAKGSIMFRPPDNATIGPPVRLVYNKWIPVNHRIKFEFTDLPLP